LSVTNKSGIAEFALSLASLDIEILSTGGTFRVLKEAGIARLREVSDVTQFPEMLDGRVKTLHPSIAGGILAMRANADHMHAIQEHGIPPIDLVCVNLYEFEKIASNQDAPLADLIENIDIGGPTMIRAAAKNYQDVAVVTSPEDYQWIVDELRSGRGSLSAETHWKLARKAFSTTAAYDRAVSARLDQVAVPGSAGHIKDPIPATLDIRAPKALALRYGENPHQSAALYAAGHAGIAGATQI
jgi:phosphoribosylaminoimidazolecarboxamide formyltransferase/IMP cyclohydrolase